MEKSATNWEAIAGVAALIAAVFAAFGPIRWYLERPRLEVSLQKEFANTTFGLIQDPSMMITHQNHVTSLATLAAVAKVKNPSGTNFQVTTANLELYRKQGQKPLNPSSWPAPQNSHQYPVPVNAHQAIEFVMDLPLLQNELQTIGAQPGDKFLVHVVTQVGKDFRSKPWRVADYK